MKKMRLWYTCRDKKKRVESVFSAHYTHQLDTAVVVQEEQQSQVSVKVNSFVAISSFPWKQLSTVAIVGFSSVWTLSYRCPVKLFT